MSNGEFYIGYQPKAPAAIARLRMRFVVLTAISALIVAALAAAFQRPLPSGYFEFGVDRTFEGTILERSTPVLRAEEAEGNTTDYVLVAFGKFGFVPDADLTGARVRLTGSVMRKNGLEMIEVHGPVEQIAAGPIANNADENDVQYSQVRLLGELVDTKCYTGVMRPATGKVHRACAVRCLSGGIPPGLLVREADGSSKVYVLEGADGGALDFDPQWAALTVAVEGLMPDGEMVPVIRVNKMDRVSE